MKEKERNNKRKKKIRKKKKKKKKEPQLTLHTFNFYLFSLTLTTENILFLFNLYLFSLSFIGDNNTLIISYYNIFKGLTPVVLLFIWLKYSSFYIWIIFSILFFGLQTLNFIGLSYMRLIIILLFLRIFTGAILKYIPRFQISKTNILYIFIYIQYYATLYTTLYFNIPYLFNIKMDSKTSKFILILILKHLYNYTNIDSWEIQLLIELYITQNINILLIFIVIPLTIKLENLNVIVSIIFCVIYYFYPILQAPIISIFILIRLYFGRLTKTKNTTGKIRYVLLMYPQIYFFFTKPNILKIF